MLTDNPVLVRNLHPVPALCCAQRKATKMIPTEDDFVEANIKSFGNEIGSITNRVTSMYEVRSHFDKDSEEYRTLSYRIRCGQTYQQNAIDKAKGIVSKPIPKTWCDRYEINRMEDEQDKILYSAIVADKKPYFMRYIYPALMKQYNTYIKSVNRNSLREFQIEISELTQIESENLTERQREFLKYYHLFMPVGVGGCVMNKICRRFEEEFSRCNRQTESATFDYRIMKSDAGYTTKQFGAVKRLIEGYNKRMRNFAIVSKYERIDDGEIADAVNQIDEEFRRECAEICPNEESLCNIVLDICYMKNSTKRFAWSMCKEQIIKNLLKRSGNMIYYPTMDDSGNIEFNGERFIINVGEIVE